jgi:uncharacterized protein YeaO (DUF488 family)
MEAVVSAINLSRVHDHEPSGEGKVFLVERLWPRGIVGSQRARSSIRVGDAAQL